MIKAIQYDRVKFLVYAVIALGVIVLVQPVAAHEESDADHEHDAEVEVEARTTVEADEEEDADRVESDTDADGRADVSSSDASDPDDDGDGVPAEREPRRSPTREVDKASPQMMDSGDDQTTPALYQGVRVSGALCEGDDCDDSDDDARPERAAQALRVEVSGNDVRGMSEEKKAEVLNRLETINEINDANDFGISVAGAALSDENVVDIATDDERTEVRYRTRVYLFGFIPKTAEVVARAESGGEAEVDYPWYGFFSGKGDQSAVIDLATRIRQAHDGIVVAAPEGEEEAE